MSVGSRASVLVWPLAIALVAVSVGLLLTRGGGFAALGIALGLGMLAKAWWRPGDADLRWMVWGVAAWCTLWGGTLGAVYLGWESGEVVALRPVDSVTGEAFELRVWVVDDAVTGHPVVFYDGSRERLAAIGKQATLEWVRGDVTHRSRPTLHWIDEASPGFVARITGLFEAKYRAQSWATNAFFLLAGRAPGRTVGILELAPVEATWHAVPDGASAAPGT